MERMGDILARNASRAARHTRLTQPRPTTPAQPNQPPTAPNTPAATHAPATHAPATRRLATSPAAPRAARPPVQPDAQPTSNPHPVQPDAQLTAAPRPPRRAAPTTSVPTSDADPILELPTRAATRPTAPARPQPQRPTPQPYQPDALPQPATPTRPTTPLTQPTISTHRLTAHPQPATPQRLAPSLAPSVRPNISLGAAQATTTQATSLTLPIHNATTPAPTLRAGRGSSGMASLGDTLRDYARELADRRASRPTTPPTNNAPKASRRNGPTSGSGGTGGNGDHHNHNTPNDDAPNAVCPHCGGAGYLRLDVPVGDPRFGQPTPCVCKERELEERHRLENERRRQELDRFFSLAPFHDKTFTTFDPALPGMREPYDVAHAYAANPTGWLVLMGGYGVGKTHLAAAIAHQRLAAGQSVYFAVVTELLDHLRAAFAPNSELTYDEMFDKIREVELLVLDDLGAENSTAWAVEKLFQLINYRYNLRIPTVITTNNQLHSHMDPRLRSRLADLSLVQTLQVKAPDHRPRNVRRPSHP